MGKQAVRTAVVAALHELEEAKSAGTSESPADEAYLLVAALNRRGFIVVPVDDWADGADSRVAVQRLAAAIGELGRLVS